MEKAGLKDREKTKGPAKQARKVKNRFTRLLADLGFVQVQYSVYARYTPTQSGCRSAIAYIRAGLPPHGNVRLLCVTRTSNGRIHCDSWTGNGRKPSNNRNR